MTAADDGKGCRHRLVRVHHYRGRVRRPRQVACPSDEGIARSGGSSQLHRCAGSIRCLIRYLRDGPAPGSIHGQRVRQSWGRQRGQLIEAAG